MQSYGCRPSDPEKKGASVAVMEGRDSLSGRGVMRSSREAVAGFESSTHARAVAVVAFLSLLSSPLS
jgi:hypothetical protein